MAQWLSGAGQARPRLMASARARARAAPSLSAAIFQCLARAARTSVWDSLSLFLGPGRTLSLSGVLFILAWRCVWPVSHWRSARAGRRGEAARGRLSRPLLSRWARNDRRAPRTNASGRACGAHSAARPATRTPTPVTARPETACSGARGSSRASRPPSASAGRRPVGRDEAVKICGRRRLVGRRARPDRQGARAALMSDDLWVTV